MDPTRRLFLRDAALSVIVASVAAPAFAQKPIIPRNEIFAPENLSTLDGISAQVFEPWIGSSFRVSSGNKSMGSLILLSVLEAGSETKNIASNPSLVRRVGQVPQATSGLAVTSFSLRFQSSRATLPQDTYLLSHEWLGTFPLLLVPSGLSGTHTTCTAVFSLLTRAGIQVRE